MSPMPPLTQQTIALPHVKPLPKEHPAAGWSAGRAAETLSSFRKRSPRVFPRQRCQSPRFANLSARRSGVYVWG